MVEGFEVHVCAGSPEVFVLSGELDMAGAPQLRIALAAATGDVLVDCRRLDFMDSSGISVLVEAWRDCERRGSQLTVRGASGIVRRTFEIMGLTEMFGDDERTPSVS